MKNFLEIDQTLERKMDDSIQELSRLVAQPSISATGAGLKECAQLLITMLKERGFDVREFSDGIAPILFAEREGKGEKTILFYNHYDVQPVEPVELWNSPPFEPEIRDGRLFGRGTCDNKGNITNRLFTLDAFEEVVGEYPCNIKFLIEGEEEVSNKHLADFVKDNSSLLTADACIWEFGGVDHTDIPVQYLGLRGCCYVQLDIEVANQDVHSGIGGSIFPNAAWRLVWALDSLKNPDEKILLPNFYDSVIPPSKRDIELMDQLPDESNYYKELYGIKEFLKGIQGGTDLKLAEVFEPTCTICGLSSGYQGSGSKTILPAKASAKIDFRLVPNQTPGDVLKQLRQHLDSLGFEDIMITNLGGDLPERTDPDDPFIQILVSTAEEVYGSTMRIMPMTGGSGPNYIIKQALKIPIGSMGVGYPESNAHAPNENIRLDHYLNAARHLARALQKFGDS